jgi:DNA-binding transcriptional LysR family regulator
MELHHLKIFASVYRNKSFTKASKQLHISQPTVSEHIKNLETTLGCNLFDRLGRTILPTIEADLLYPRALKILDDLDRLQEDLAMAGERIGGELVLGASTIPGTYILPGLAVGFKEKHPDISFEIRIGDTASITESVLNHELLYGIVGARTHPQQLDYQPLFADELILVAAPKFILGRLHSRETQYTVPFLIREQGSGTRNIMEYFLNQAAINIDRLNIVATLGSTAAIREALKTGLGASILSRLAVQEELQAGKLQEYQIPGLEMKRNFYGIKHKKRTLPLHYQAFSHYIHRSADQQQVLQFSPEVGS